MQLHSFGNKIYLEFIYERKHINDNYKNDSIAELCAITAKFVHKMASRSTIITTTIPNAMHENLLAIPSPFPLLQLTHSTECWAFYSEYFSYWSSKQFNVNEIAPETDIVNKYRKRQINLMIV